MNLTQPSHSVLQSANRMLLVALIAALIQATPFSQQDLAAAEKSQGKLLFIGIACDAMPPKGKTQSHYDYAPDNFSRLLKAQTSETFSSVQIETLKGTSVTADAVLKKLRQVRKQARDIDLVFLYWGTHGGTGERGWSASIAHGQQFPGWVLKSELSEFPCPVIVMISTCGSGGFIHPGAKERPMPDNVAAFCACRRNQSTNNELDVSMLEALSGYADFDESGDVTLREVAEYVPKRYREWNPKVAESEELAPVLMVRESFQLSDRPLCKVDKSRVSVVHDGRWYGATILEKKGQGMKVRYLGWDPIVRGGAFSFPDEIVQEEAVDLPGGYPAVEVEWNGDWYPARILEQTQEGIRIHYIGYPSDQDEIVTKNRIRRPFVIRAQRDMSDRAN